MRCHLARIVSFAPWFLHMTLINLSFTIWSDGPGQVDAEITTSDNLLRHQFLWAMDSGPIYYLKYSCIKIQNQTSCNPQLDTGHMHFIPVLKTYYSSTPPFYIGGTSHLKTFLHTNMAWHVRLGMELSPNGKLMSIVASPIVEGSNLTHQGKLEG